MDVETRAVEFLRRELPGVQAIYLFGSRVRGDATADSDLDLAVLLPAPLEPVTRWTLAERLAALVGRDVDLVDLRTASTVLRRQVLDGRLLDVTDPTARDWFEMLALSQYLRLNEERRGILDDVRARGTVHG